MHVIYYETKILTDELIEIMKHTTKKGYAYEGIHELVDYNIYPALSSSYRLFRHVLSAKIFTRNPSHKSYKDNSFCQGNLLDGNKPNQHTVTVHGDEPIVRREQWGQLFKAKKKSPQSTSSKTKYELNKPNINTNQQQEQELITKSIGDNYDLVNDVIILNEDQLFELLCEFPKQWTEGLSIVRPILFKSPYDIDLIRRVLERWYYSREKEHQKPYPSEGNLVYEQENTNRYFFSLLNHLDQDTRKKYLAKLPKYNNVVDESVVFEINSDFSIKDLREKDYRLPYQKYGIRVGEFLTDLKRIFVFVDRGNPTYILKIYDVYTIVIP